MTSRQTGAAPLTPLTSRIGAPAKFPTQTRDDGAEWFLAGTEPAAGGPPRASAVAPVGARIIAPVSRAVIALDPDGPSRLQRMAFEAEGAVGALRWRLGDREPRPRATMGRKTDRAATGPRGTQLVTGLQRPIFFASCLI